MNRFFKRFGTFFLFVSIFLSLSQKAFPESFKKIQGDNKNVPIQVHGDNVEYFHEEQKVVGTGHVSIDYEDLKLTADQMTVYMATKRAVAEGHVTLTQKGSVFTGERLEYDFATRKGNVSQLDAAIKPSYYGKAKEIEKVSDNHYRAIDSYVTTCCGDSPFYKIQAHEVNIYPNEKVEIYNAVLYVKEMPVLFLPYFVTYFVDFNRFPVQVIPGKNSQWGAFVLTKWRYHLAEQPGFQDRGNVLLDYREKRGIGAGVENFYRGDNVGRGAARFYHVKDEGAPTKVDADRYRAQWRHQSKIGEATTLTAELNKLSDSTVIKDFFFREEYERDVFPDNYVSIITAKPEYTFSVLVRERLDDFFTVVERSPELRYDTHNRQFAETPFYLRQEVQFSNLKKQSAFSNNGLNVTRLDTNHTLSYAARLGEVSVTPHVGTRQTFYSRDAGGEREIVRGTFDPGVDISTRFYKIYDIYIKSLGLDYNQIRHVFSPAVSYNYRPNPTVLRTSLAPFDSFDAIDKQNGARFSFENKLQTKEHVSAGSDELATRDIARVITFFDTDLLQGIHQGRFTHVGIDAELRPYSWMGIVSNAAYDAKTKYVETANVDFYISKKNITLALGQSYLRRESSQTTAGLHWRINPEWELGLYERYEFKKDLSKEFEVTVSKTFECIIVDFTYNHRLQEGDTFFFTFRLKAFPEVSYKLRQSYNRPKATSQTGLPGSL